MARFGMVLVFVALTLILLASQAEAKTAVTISVEAGPAFTEGNLQTVDLIVTESPAEALPLQVGDKVFFEALEPMFEGEGTITDVYEVEDTAEDLVAFPPELPTTDFAAEESGPKRAIIIEHIPAE